MITTPSDTMAVPAIDTSPKTYDPNRSFYFFKAAEAFGALSNMSGSFPLQMGGVLLRSSEALYQACRFPHLPEVQRTILEQSSPMSAKMKAKTHRKTNSRADWNEVQVQVMWWCLRVKLAHYLAELSRLLRQTKDWPIVEKSTKDDFWGARVSADGKSVVGQNVLGQLWTALREQLAQPGAEERFRQVEPLDILDFKLVGSPIPSIEPKGSLRGAA